MDKPPQGAWRAAVILTVVTLAGPAGAAEAPSLRLKWHHQTQFAGFYVAEQQGWYRQEGLRLQIREGSFQIQPTAEVARGESTFGITSHPQFLQDRERGWPLVAVAAVYQKSPAGFFALRRSGITRPEQFAGKTISFAPTHEIHLRAMLKQVGVDFRSLRVRPYGYDLRPWYAGEVQIWAGYVMNQPVDARLAGHEVTIIFPDDYGVHMYDDLVVVADRTLRQEPDLVRRFLRASVRGWWYALVHPEEAVGMTRRVDPKLDPVKQLAMLRASAPLIHTGEAPIGWMRQELMEQTQALLREQGLLARSVPVERTFTTRFLPAQDEIAPRIGKGPGPRP